MSKLCVVATKIIFLLLAVSPGLKANLGGPCDFDTHFYFDFYNENWQSGSREVDITFNGEDIYTDEDIPRLEIKSFSRAVKPGVIYKLRINKQQGIRYGMSINAPEGYIAEVDGELKNAFYLQGNAAEDKTYEIAWRSLAVLRGGQGMAVGQASELRIGDIKWEVGLGKLRNGRSAGMIQLCDDDLKASTYTRANLGVHTPPYDSNDLKLIYEDLDSDGTKESIRQIKAPQCLVDIVDTDFSGSTVTGYEIRFYRTGTFNSGTGLYTPTGSTLVTYHIYKSATDKLTLVKTGAGSTITGVITKTNDGTHNDWNLTITGGAYQKSVAINNSASGNNRQEDVTINYGQSPSGLPAVATKTYQIRNVYRSFNPQGEQEIGEKVISQTFNLGDANHERTHTYTYYDENILFGDIYFGLLKSSQDAFGNWHFYEYENVDYRGNGQRPIHNFMEWAEDNFLYEAFYAMYPYHRTLKFDVFAENDGFNFNENGDVSQIGAPYGAGQVVLKELSQGISWDEANPSQVRSNNTIKVGSSFVRTHFSKAVPIAFPLDYQASGASNNFIEVQRRYYYHNQQAYDDLKTDGTSYEARYVPSQYASGFDYNLAFKPYYKLREDNVKTSHGYATVASYEGISNAWVEVSVLGKKTDFSDVTYEIDVTSQYTNQTFNGLPLELAIRMIDSHSYPGSARNALYQDMLTRFSHGQTTHSHSGHDFQIDAVDLIPGKSTKTVKAFNDLGELKREESWVYDSSSSWKLTTLKKYTHDGFSRVTEIRQSDGVAANERVIYEAGYQGLRKTYEIDETGARTDFGYDGLDRVASRTVSKSHGVTGIPTSLTTSIKRDALGRAVETEVGPSGNTLTSTKELGAEGMLLSETDQNGLTTTYAYSKESGAGRRVDITRPGGRVETQIYHRNGRLKSITGNSVIPRYYEYSYDTSGGTNNLITRVDTGYDSSSSTPHPHRITWQDWFGRTTREEHSSATGQNAVTIHGFDLFNARLNYTEQTEVAEGGTNGNPGLRTLFEYDDLGSVFLSGIDVDGNNDLTLASSDRLTQTETTFVTDSGKTWSKISTKVYPSNTVTAFETITRSQLTGLNATQVSTAEAIDVHGNKTTTNVTLNRAAAITISTTTYPDNSTESQTTVMGLLSSHTNRQGNTTGYRYDGIGRPEYETKPRGHECRTEYESGKARVWKYTTGMLNGAGGYTTEYHYDSAGRKDWEKNPNGKTDYFAYNLRNQPTKMWGDTVYPVWNEYDALGQLWKQHTYHQNSGDTVPDFNAANWPAGDITTTLYFDAAGLMQSRTDAAGKTTSYTYDQRGRIKTRTTPSGGGASAVTTTYKYFPKTDELKSVDYSDSTPDISYTYHRAGTVATVTEGGTHTWTNHYDYSSGTGSATAMQMLSTDLPSYYTAITNLASNDSNHKVDAFAYSYQQTSGSNSIKGRRNSLKTGIASGTAGTLMATRYTSDYTFDAFGRVDGVTVESNQVDYSYAPNSSLIAARSVIGSPLVESRTYEANRDLLQSISTSANGVLKIKHAYAHDNLGRRESQTQTGYHYTPYGPGIFTSYAYNDRNELTNLDVYTGVDSSVVGNNDKRIPGRGLGFEYDTLGNRKSMTRKAVDIGGTVADQTFTYTTNNLNQYTARQHPDWIEISGAALNNQVITVGQPGSLLKPKRLENKWFHYHLFYPLRPNGQNGYIHDSVNLYAVERAAGGPNGVNGGQKDKLTTQPLSAHLRPSSETLAYDARGNLKTDARWTYTWDAENRLTAIESSAAAISAGETPVKIRFRYDYLNRRYLKETYTWNGSSFSANPTQAILYYWDGWNMVHEAKYDVTYSGSNPASATFADERKYYWGLDWSGTLQSAGGVGGLIGMTKRDAGQAVSPPAYPLFDGNGNLMALYQADGTALAEYEYSPYGRLVRINGSWAEDNPMRFATKYAEVETDLYYYQERYYSPEMGRFISRDPIGTEGGLNLYGFVNNNPVSLIDAFGQFTFAYDGGFSSMGFGLDGYNSPWSGYGLGDSFTFESSFMFGDAGQWAWDAPDWSAFDISSQDILGNVNAALFDEAQGFFNQALADPNLGRSTLDLFDYDTSEWGLVRARQFALDQGGLPSMVDRVFSAARTGLTQQFADAAASLRAFDAYNSSFEGRLRRAVEIGYYAPGAATYGLAEVSGVNPFLRTLGGEITPTLGFQEVSLADRGLGLAEMAMIGIPLRSARYVDDILDLGGGASRPFALGIDNHLDDFARIHGADTWKNFDDVVDWRPQVFDKLADPNQRVLFNLDDVDVWGGVNRAASGRGGATDWELLQIYQNPHLWNNNIEFWKGGKRTSNPFE